jgi:hypothetical protein
MATGRGLFRSVLDVWDKNQDKKVKMDEFTSAIESMNLDRQATVSNLEV